MLQEGMQIPDTWGVTRKQWAEGAGGKGIANHQEGKEMKIKGNFSGNQFLARKKPKYPPMEEIGILMVYGNGAILKTENEGHTI